MGSAFSENWEDQDAVLQSIKQSYDNFMCLARKFPLERCQILRRRGNYARGQYFKKKGVKEKWLIWQSEDIPRSLIKLNAVYCGGNKKLAKHCKAAARHIFKNIRGFMGDVYH